MSAYLIARVNVTNWDKYSEYMKLTPAIVANYGGKFISRGGELVTLEGPEEKNRVVILAFDSVDSAKAFYHSAAYQTAVKIRAGAAEAQFIIVDGV